MNIPLAFIFVRIEIYIFLFLNKKNNPFKVLRNCLKEKMLLVLHVVFLKFFLWNPKIFLWNFIFRDCSFNQFRTEKLAEWQITECMDSLKCTVVYNSDSIWMSIIMFQISALEPKKHQRKISIEFGEGLQILVFAKVYLGFFMLFKVSINTWQN